MHCARSLGLVLVPSLFLAGQAHAANTNGSYLFAQLGAAVSDVACSTVEKVAGSGVDSDCDSSAAMLGIGYGARWQNLGFQLGYTQSGNFAVDIPATSQTGDASLKILRADVLAYLNAGRKEWDFYGKAGIAVWEGKYSLRGGASDSGSDDGVTVGVGGGILFATEGSTSLFFEGDYLFGVGAGARSANEGAFTFSLGGRLQF